MAKLYFRYSAMNAGKSLDLLKTAFNYEERGQNVLIFTSGIDVRYGKNKIKSRVGLEKEAISIDDDTDIVSIFINKHLLNQIDCVLVDESQFLSKKHIYQLTEIVDMYNTPVICYGLRSDFRIEPFEGSTYLMAIADSIEELKTICWCGKKATVNARLINGKITTSGEQVQLGGNESYTSLCRKHFKERKVSKE